MSKRFCEEVTYTKPSTGEITDRVIIPVTQAQPNVKAIDVTDMDSSERAEMVELFNEYQEYVDACIKQIFSFEDFISHTTGEEKEVKWRTFRSDHLEIID